MCFEHSHDRSDNKAFFELLPLQPSVNRMFDFDATFM